MKQNITPYYETSLLSHKAWEETFLGMKADIIKFWEREPFYNHSTKLFCAAENNIKIHVSLVAFTNLNHILSMQKKKLLKFKTPVTLSTVDDEIINLALASDF